MTIIDEEKKYRELKESIRIMNNQRSDTEKWKYKMKSYCLKYKKDTEKNSKSFEF